MSEKIGMLPFSAIVKIEVNGAFLTRVKSFFYVGQETAISFGIQK